MCLNSPLPPPVDVFKFNLTALLPSALNLDFSMWLVNNRFFSFHFPPLLSFSIPHQPLCIDDSPPEALGKFTGGKVANSPSSSNSAAPGNTTGLANDDERGSLIFSSTQHLYADCRLPAALYVLCERSVKVNFSPFSYLVLSIACSAKFGQA